MLNRVLKRIAISIPVLVGVVLAIFIMLRIVPGNPVTTMMGEHVNPAVIEKISREMGLDQPLYVQFFRYIANALRGDFGTSYRLNRNVTGIILEAFPNTVKLSLLAAVIAWLIGIVSGRLAVNGIETRDMPLLQGTVVFTTILIILGNLIADLLYNVLDPRIREGA